ncbi:MAG: hypothetical protein U1G07_21185 [Verrucomicrobiota bacterium]
MRLPNQAVRGWGSFELPADGNRFDNAAYFVYSPEAAVRATIVSDESQGARWLQLAIAAGARDEAPIVDVLTSAKLGRAVWEDNTLLVWRETLPTGAIAQRIRTFAEQGGTVLFLPPGQKDPARFEGVAWGDVQAASPDRPFRIVRWNEEEGPLAKSDEGLSLPLGQTMFVRRQALVGQKPTLAAFDDGTPFFVRQALGRGEIYFCASSPDPEWSGLGEGPVLVPMMQRLLQSGSRRLQQDTSVECGQLSTVDQGLRWESVDSTNPKDIRTRAGVYRAGDRFLAVNRPLAEDDPEVLPSEEAKRLFGTLGVQMLQERRGGVDKLQGEIWRVFVFGMLLLLVAEGWLILPARQAEGPVGREALAGAAPPAAEART